jgi:chromosome segregation ATPase
MGTVDDRDPAADLSFAVVRHGFDRTAVRQHVTKLVERAERAEADGVEAQAQAAELQGELEIARREITALTERLESTRAPEGADAARLLEVARAQAVEITARAKAAAEDTWSAAEQASAALLDRYRTMLTDLDEQHKSLNTAHQSIMRSAQAQAEELTTVAERRRRELDAEAERDRIRIDREFSESMNARRKALTRDLEQRRAACEKEIADRLRAADEEARHRVDSVTEQVTMLSSVRAQLSDHLRETRELLERGVALLEPVDQEREQNLDDAEGQDTATRQLPAAESSTGQAVTEPGAEPSTEPAAEPAKRVPPQRAKRSPSKRQAIP